MNVNGEKIPQALRSKAQWVAWRIEVREGKPTKVPVDPHTGTYGSCSDPTTWGTFEHATRCFEIGNHDGVGFVFSASDPFAGIDLDKCRDPEKGVIEPWAQEIIRNLGSYTEISPSGTGVHIFVMAKLPMGRRRKGRIEMYDSGRYFTVTGAQLKGTPSTIEERTKEVCDLHARIFDTSSGCKSNSNESRPVSAADADLLNRAAMAANGAKFTSLWRGGSTGYASQSEADLALCMMLAFWTGRDGKRMDKLFRDSARIRPKWDKKHDGDGRTYGQITIDKAIAQTTEVWTSCTGHDVVHSADNRSHSNSSQRAAQGINFPQSAFVGVGGEFANAYEPEVESPPEFLLTGYWTYFGALVSPYVDLDLAAPAESRLYTVHLGESATPRKSSVQAYLAQGFSGFESLRVHNGFGSAEGLAKYIQQQGESPVLLQLDELKLLVDKCQQQTGSVGLTLVNTLYERTEFDNATVRGSLRLLEAHLSMLAGCTVETYADMFSSEFIAIGFPNRLFLVHGERKKKIALPRKPNESILQAIRNRARIIVQRIIEKTKLSGGEKLVVPFEALARKRFEEWYESLESSVHARRLEGLALRIATILALTCDESSVTRQILEIALTVADYELTVRRLYDPVDADGKVAAMEAKIRRALEAKGPLKERELRQLTHADRTGIWVFQSALRNLVSVGDIYCDSGKIFHLA